MKRERVVIIGSGPAGMAAAVYTARAQLNPVIIVGKQFGGQAAITHEIENYPGFVDPIGGAELAERMKSQSERFGAQYVWDEVSKVDFSQRPFKVETYNETYLADSVIVTIGADPRKLHIPGEGENIGRGVSYCGTCDGFFFRGKEVVVVGGGDSAFEEGIFLTRFATKVTIMYRKGQDQLRASIALQTRAAHNPKINILYNTVINRIDAADHAVSSVNITDTVSGVTSDFKTDGVFVFIGHDPNSGVFNGQIATDESGYIITDSRYRTSIEGVFAGGEIQDPIWRQVATSVGQGTAAGMSAIQWLEAHEDELQVLDEAAVEVAVP
ncbi:MAG: thioredoxin-disulfide reductase [Phototrophicaceae bacterium]|jgi:thioredoxin reductase (NADPH)